MLFWVLSPDWRSRKPETCDCWQTHWWRRLAREREMQAVPRLYIIYHRHPSYNWGKARNNISQSIRKVSSWTEPGTMRSVDLATVLRWPRLNLLAAFALGLGVRLQRSTLDQRRYTPSCELRDSFHQLTLSQNLRLELWCRRRMDVPNPRESACY